MNDTVIDPNEFIISRKRKKYKFAKFANASNCFEFDEWQLCPVDYLEVGAGTGVFSVELAKRYPRKTFVALDVKADRLQKAAYDALENNVSNVLFLRARADQIDELFKPHSLDAIWLNFADPFPRGRSERRRMTHPIYLKKYAELLRIDASLFIKHDSRDFFHWSLEQLVKEKWRINELSFDLHGSELLDDYKIETTYERRWRLEGLVTNFVKALPADIAS